MRLATLRDGTRDGRLAVVRRDGAALAAAGPATPTMQAALDGCAAAGSCRFEPVATDPDCCATAADCAAALGPPAAGARKNQRRKRSPTMVS